MPFRIMPFRTGAVCIVLGTIMGLYAVKLLLPAAIGLISGLITGWWDGCMIGWLNGWMDGWIDVWMD